MINEPVVSLHRISKVYRLFDSRRDRLKEALHPFRKKYHREFRVLRDINLDIHQGETIGIIGRNGAGKSTLLQIISSVVQPTTGRVDVHGSVSALLELGAGFNPEFTGRENVLLHGAIMGFSRSEMEERMPLIEDFAAVGEFFDRPVKTYSSGMYVRVAFSAAINVDPDILIIDEALAVGDLRFQAKCYNLLDKYKKQSKTIIFVSHDNVAVTRLCHRVVLLDQGRIHFEGDPRSAVNHYDRLLFSGDDQNGLKSAGHKTGNKNETVKEMFEKFRDDSGNAVLFDRHADYNPHHFYLGDSRARLLDYLITANDMPHPTRYEGNETIKGYAKYYFERDVSNVNFGIAICTIEGVLLLGSNLGMKDRLIAGIRGGTTMIFEFVIKLSLLSGSYYLNFGLSEESGSEIRFIDNRRSIVCFQVDNRIKAEGIVDMHSSIEVLNLDRAGRVRDGENDALPS